MATWALEKHVTGKKAGNNDKDYIGKPLKCPVDPVDERKRSLLRGREVGTLVV